MIFLQTKLRKSSSNGSFVITTKWKAKGNFCMATILLLFYTPQFILFLTLPRMQFWFQKVLFKNLRYLKCTLLSEIFRVTFAMITIYYIYDRLICRDPPRGLPPYHGEEVCVPQWPRQLWWQKHRLLIGPPMPDRSKSRGQMKYSPWSSRLGAGGWAWG
jgi:hypothetical protein